MLMRPIDWDDMSHYAVLPMYDQVELRVEVYGCIRCGEAPQAVSILARADVDSGS